MKRCARCGTELPAEHRVCHNCGARQGEVLGAQARVEDSGAVAQQGAQATGERGVTTGQDAYGPIVTGDNNSVIYIVREYVDAGGQDPDRANLQRQIAGYLNWMRERFGTIELRGIKREGQQVVQLNLETTYVPLEAETFVGRGDRRRVGMEHELDLGWHRIGMDQILDWGRRLTITGGPGSGKTTVLQYIAWMLTNAIAVDEPAIALNTLGLDLDKEKKERIQRLSREVEEGRVSRREQNERRGEIETLQLPLPVFIPLSAYARHLRALSDLTDPRENTLAAFISRYLIERQSGLDLPGDFFARLLENGQATILLLDGLDEVPSETERVQVREAIEDLVAGREEMRAVVTCRTAAYRERTTLGRGFRNIRVRALKDEHIEALVQRAYAHIYPHDSTARQRKTAELLRGIHDLEEERQLRLGKEAERLITSPLLVRMLLVVHFSERRLPEHRAELYMKATDAMLLPGYAPDEAVAERIGRLVGGSREVHRELVQHLAFAMHRRGEVQGREITERELRKVLAAGSFSDSLADDFIALTRLRGTLLEEQMGSYRFIHTAFQEYLAARYLAEVKRGEGGVDSVVAFFEDGPILDLWWREPVLLVVGYLSLTSLPTARLLLRRLACVGAGRTAPSANVQMASAEAAAAAYLQWQNSDVELRLTIVECLLTLFEDTELMNQTCPIIRARAGDALTRLGDRRFCQDAWYLPDEPLLGFIKIPEGQFLMGDGAEQHEMALPTYFIARYPVTVAQFRAFVKDTGHELQSGSSLRDPDNHPVARVTWHDALTYCSWLTSRLQAWEETPEPLAMLLKEMGWVVAIPSEAEWEKAARGSDGRAFPWGELADPNRANWQEAGIGTTSPVGCFPGGASPYGIEDLSGNVWEWTRSEHKDYPYDPEDGREKLDRGDHIPRVLRGGSYYTVNAVRCAYRDWDRPISYSMDGGFRVTVTSFLSNSDSVHAARDRLQSL